MNFIKDEELVFTSDLQRGINSCGFGVNSLLMNSGISPIMTVNNKSNKTNTRLTDLFNNLVVPNWTLHYDSNLSSKSKSKKQENMEEDSFEIVDDNLYDKLIGLVSNERKDDYDELDEKETKKKNKYKKTKRNNKKKEIDLDIPDGNTKQKKNKKYKKTRKQIMK